MKFYYTLITTLLIVLTSITSCKLDQDQMNSTTDKIDDQTEVELSIAPPMDGIDVPYQSFDVDAVKGRVIKLSTGTVIRIPKNAFVDTDGKPLTGKVNVKYREFHDLASIISSGIPLQNRGDFNKHMESAGMFDIRADSETGEVMISREKSIEVDMASYVEGNQYDFFHLEEEDCNWVDKGTADPIENRDKVLISEKGEPEKPIRPAEHDSDKFVFDLDINYQAFPELKAYKEVIWQYDGTKDKEDPEKNPWVFKEDWNSVDLNSIDASKGKYSLVLRAGEKQFSTVVRPVLSGKNFQEALKEFLSKNEQYEKAKKALTEERERVEQEADLMRRFSIEQFGIFNWDIWKRSNRVIVGADFDFGPEIDTDINQINVFLVTGDGNSVIRYSPSNFGKFSFNPDESNMLLAILPGNEIAYYSKEAFRRIDSKKLRFDEGNGKPFTFEMQRTGKKMESLDQLREVIKSLG